MKKMIKYPCFISLLLLCSCLEALDDGYSWVKVSGNELESSGTRLKKLPNGEIVIMGSTSRAGFSNDVGFTNSLGVPKIESKIISAPSIEWVDIYGNTIRKRVYPGDSIQLDNGPYPLRLDFGIAKASGGSMRDMIPLSNGNYLVQGAYEEITGEWLDGSGPYTFETWFFYAVLDKQFTPLHFRYSFDGQYGQVEAFENKHVGDNSFFDSGDGNVLILFLKSEANLYGFGRPALIKIDPQADTIWGPTYYDQVSSGDTRAYDLIVDPVTNDILVLSERRDYGVCTCVNHAPHISRISSEGTLIIEKRYGGLVGPPPPGTEFRSHQPRRLFQLESGYAMALMQNLNDFDGINFDNELLHYGLGMKFLGSDLEETSHILITDKEVQDLIDVIQTKDKGFVFLAQQLFELATEGLGLAIKTDSKGNELWRYEFVGDPNAIIETDDGGIIILTTKRFNDLGVKQTLIKLNSNGRL